MAISEKKEKRCGVVRMVIAIVAIAFGALTIKSGGDVLFWSEEARIAAGNYVPLVLWFNFLAGFAYIIAGFAFIWRKTWAVPLAISIAVSTALVFAALGLNIYFADLAYEQRTIGAMTLRTVVWTVLAFLAYKSIKGAYHE